MGTTDWCSYCMQLSGQEYIIISSIVKSSTGNVKMIVPSVEMKTSAISIQIKYIAL